MIKINAITNYLVLLLVLVVMVSAGTILSDDGNITITGVISGGSANHVIVAADGTGQYTNLKTAIDSIDNGYVYVKDGDYTVTTSIEIDDGKNISVVCAGWGAHIYGGSNTGVNGIFYVDDATFSIENCRVDGDGQVLITSPMCINGRTSSEGRIYANNNLIENCYYDGIYTKGVTLVATNNEVRNTGRQGITLVGGENHIISNNYVHDTAHNLIDLENSAGYSLHNIRITDNLLENAGISSGGIVTSATGTERSNWVITGNVINNVQLYGIYVFNVTNGAVISNNKLYNVSNLGIMFNEGSKAIITGNTVVDSGSKCINIKNSPNAVIANNNVDDCGSYGVWFESSLTGTSTVTGNIIKNTVGYGIRINAEYSTVTGNFIQNVGNSTDQGHGIYVNAAGIEVIGNSIIDLRGASSGLENGILISGSSTHTIIGNYINGYTNSSVWGVVDGNNVLANTGVNNYLAALSGTYGGGSAYVCVYDNGELYAKETAC